MPEKLRLPLTSITDAIYKLSVVFAIMIAGGAGCQARDDQLYDSSGHGNTYPPVILPFGSAITLDRDRNLLKIVLPPGTEVQSFGNYLLIINNQPNLPWQDIIEYYQKKGEKMFAFTFERDDKNIFLFHYNPDKLQSAFSEGQYPPIISPFKQIFWNGKNVSIQFSQEIWQNAFDACTWLNDGKYNPNFCNVALILAIRATENFLPPEDIIPYSPSGACGPYQVMPDTWAWAYGMRPINIPGFTNNCHDERDSAIIATIFTQFLKLHEQTDENAFIRRFAGQDGGSVWNRHAGHARVVWEIMQRINEYLASIGFPVPDYVKVDSREPPSKPHQRQPETPIPPVIDSLNCQDCLALTIDVEYPDCSLFPNDKKATCLKPEESVPQILEILAKYGVKATFFILGRIAEENPDLVKQILAAGHTVGSHSHDHRRYPQLTKADMKQDAQKAIGALTKAGVTNPIYFRLPYGDGWLRGVNGSVYQVLCEELGLKIVGWNIDSRDYRGLGPDEIVANVVKQSQTQSYKGRGGIALFHSYSPYTPTAIETIIKQLLYREDVRFVSLGEVFPGNNNPQQNNPPPTPPPPTSPPKSPKYRVTIGKGSTQENPSQNPTTKKIFFIANLSPGGDDSEDVLFNIIAVFTHRAKEIRFGSYQREIIIPPKGAISFNAEFAGNDCYGYTRVAGGVRGGGVCNAASMLRQEASMAGLRTVAKLPPGVKDGHRTKIPGVDPQYATTIWCDPNEALERDLIIANDHQSPAVIKITTHPFSIEIEIYYV